jgi:hypothetical protein
LRDLSRSARQLASVHGNWRQVLQTFSSLPPEERADVGEGVVLIGRWHDISSRSGVAILDSDDVAAVHRFIGRWTSHMDIDLAPVLEDEETAAVAKQILADHEAR